MDSIASAVETRRIAQGLTVTQLADCLGLSYPTTKALIVSGDVRSFVTLAKVVVWLGIAPDNALRSSGLWERLSPYGRLLAPAMVERHLDARALSEIEGAPTYGAIRSVLWGSHLPNEGTLDWLAERLDVDLAALIRHRRETAERRSPRALTGKPRSLLKKKGRGGLVEHGKRLQVLFKRSQKGQRERLSRGEPLAQGEHDLRRSEIGREGAQAARRFWASATDTERARLRLNQLRPAASGTFGICRVCHRVTYQPPSRNESSTVEYHGTCMSDWRAQDPGYALWLSSPEGKPPQPAYPRTSRPTSAELASMVRMGIEYIQIRERSWGKGRRTRGRPSTVAELVEQMTAASVIGGERDLYRRLWRLVDLLPKPSVCNRHLRPRVVALERLASHLQRPRAAA